MENSKTFLQEGSKPTLEEVLYNREKRVNYIKKLLFLYPECTIISFKLNIPGPVKNNDALYKIFQNGLENISNCIQMENLESLYSKELNLKTGPEYFEAVKANYLFVKEKMTYIEENSSLGRLFDIDVLYMKKGEVQNVSRDELNLPKRKCFVCSNDAKICSSRRTHSISEMFECIEKLVIKDGNIL